jgi:Delta3-Delta2-enoyl-CoA isomerase
MANITLETKDRVGVMTMNYKKENRFNPEFLSEMRETLDAVENDKGIGALVVTGGDPKFFSNGLDIEWMMAHAADRPVIIDYLKSVNQMFKRWCVFPKPTIAACNGHVFAGGLFMAAHMDFRFMREDRGWICLPEVDINIPLLPGMIAICQAVMTASGFHAVYYTGKRFTGPEAVKFGFIDNVFPDEELLPRSIALAAELAKKKTATYAEMKRRIRCDIARILDEVDPQHFEKTLAFVMSV